MDFSAPPYAWGDISSGETFNNTVVIHSLFQVLQTLLIAEYEFVS